MSLWIKMLIEIRNFICQRSFLLFTLVRILRTLLSFSNIFFTEVQPIKPGNFVIITEKLHGTSCRCGLSMVNHEEGFLSRLKRLFKLNKQRSEYEFVVGSRRVVKSVGGEAREGVNHYYDEDLWTKASNEHFKGKLNKGETVYFEIVGFTPTGAPIMGNHSNSKLQDFMDKEEYKEFIERYGEETVFSYGCSRHASDVTEYTLPEYKLEINDKGGPIGYKQIDQHHVL